MYACMCLNGSLSPRCLSAKLAGLAVKPNIFHQSGFPPRGACIPQTLTTNHRLILRAMNNTYLSHLNIPIKGFLWVAMGYHDPTNNSISPDPSSNQPRYRDNGSAARVDSSSENRYTMDLPPRM